MIQVSNVSKAYIDKVLLDKVNFTLDGNKKIGLIGLNGTGKTTLFKIILKQDEPDSGSVIYIDEEIGYLPQVLEFKDDDTVFSYLASEIKEEWEDYKIEKVLNDVGLEKVDRNLEVKKLSGGQKTKLGISRILMNDPTTLLLDEPTNNLDAETIEWFEEFIKKFYGNVLVISHDRKFLDNVIDKIYELDYYTHKINEYVGGYSGYLKERAKRVEKQIEEFNRQQKRKKEMEDWIALKKQQLTFYQSPKVAKQLHNYEKRYQREVVNNLVDKPFNNKKIKIDNLAENLYDKKVVFKIRTLKYNIVYCKYLDIFGGDRIHLEGKNGSGKTTFIKILLGFIKDYTGELQFGNNVKIGYFSQEHDTLDNNKRIIDEFMQNSNIKLEERARDVLGSYLFCGDKVFEKVSILSQGEKVRLMVAELVNQSNNFLIFDEPTNHLDIESREVLENALSNYQGGFIIVSHDRYFIENVEVNKKIGIVNNCIIRTD